MLETEHESHESHESLHCWIREIRDIRGEGHAWGLGIEVVAEAETRYDTLGEATNLLAESSYIDIDGAIKHKHILRPDALNEFLAREHAATLVEQ